MGRAGVVLYVVALVAIVVSVDVLFFRHHFLGRLFTNVGIVLVFAAFYLTYLKRKSARSLGQGLPSHERAGLTSSTR